MRSGWKVLGVVAAAIAAAVAFAAVGGEAGTPASQPVTVPGQGGQTIEYDWSGTVPANSAHPTSDCNDAGAPGFDESDFAVSAPANGYADVTATFTWQITWTPANGLPEDVHDLVLTVNQASRDNGDTETTEVGSSDGSSTTETVIAHDVAPGTFQALACGYVNSTPQPYTGKLIVTTQAKAAQASLGSVDAQGLQFGASVPVDPQRDEAEPLIQISPDGLIYTCGPTGFSSGVDYAQVSEDGGDQFHILGDQPRGQQGLGGGGDCVMNTGITKNAAGHYQYAYAGLGALSGFATATSADNGHSIATAGADANGGVTTQGALADRQWMTFIDDKHVLLAWNQQQPRNAVVQESSDGGLTYSPVASIAAPNPDFPGQMHYIASENIVYMPWTKGEQVNLAISKDGGATWTDCKVASGVPVHGGTAGFASADNDSAGNVYVAWTDKDDYHTWLSSLSAASLAGCTQSVTDVSNTDDGEPTVDPGWTTPVQVDRDAVRTTVFPWVAAGGAPGRVAVTYYGTTSDGDPNVGTFKAAWDVYVDQSLDGGQSFGQVKATTHPFHYDSICLNGLGCDLATPPGDRSLADFFAIAYDQANGRLCITYVRSNKKPDEATGHVAATMVTCQVGGPSNGGGTVNTADRAVVRSSTVDPTGDAESSYSMTAPAVAPSNPGPKNEPGADFTGASVGPDAQTGGFTATLKVADLSQPALTQTLTDTGGQSIQYLWRFTNGYQDAAVSAAWSPAAGWTYGYDDYTTGTTPCTTAGAGSGQEEKCQVYPQATPVHGSVDTASGTITLVVPRSLLRQLGPADQDGRPTEQPAADGARFYDGTAFSLVNNASTAQAAQSFLYTLDNTPSFDFLLPAASAAAAAGGSGGTSSSSSSATTTTASSGSSSGGGGGSSAASTTTAATTSAATTTTSTPSAPSSSTPAGSPTATTPATAATPKSGVLGSSKTVSHLVSGRGYLRAIGRTRNAGFTFNRRAVTYVDNALHLRFRSSHVASVKVSGHVATIRGTGLLNGKRVPFTLVGRDGSPDTVTVHLGRYVHSAKVVKGSITIR